jgi:hypothetical protein
MVHTIASIAVGLFLLHHALRSELVQWIRFCRRVFFGASAKSGANVDSNVGSN